MTDQQLKLASEFPAASMDAWRELAEAALKGASFEKKLVTTTADGFKINPLYTLADMDETSSAIHDAILGSSHRTENVADGAKGWDIRQLHTHPDPIHTNTAILEDLENGATSIQIIFDKSSRNGGSPGSENAGDDGAMLYSLADITVALNGVFVELAPVSVDAGAAAIPAAALLAAHADTQKSEALLAFNYDPIGVLVSEGSLPVNLQTALQRLGEFAKEATAICPKATAVNVDATHWFNAGATDSAELAMALSTGITYLRAMIAAGMSVKEAANSITFTAAIGTDFFTGIAKLRALRLMWRRVLEASGEQDGKVIINAIAAASVLSKVDPWVNMLRTTVTSFAGGVGGADSVTCLPYDHSLGLPDDFSRRIARNTQLIIEEESNIHRVLDPAGGSWYIENLTRELAEAAWQKFQAIEKSGGIAGKVLDGSLVAEVAEMWKARSKRLATRLEPLTGVSEFPNIDEEPVVTKQPDLIQLRQQATKRQTKYTSAIGSSFAELVTAARAGATISQLFDAVYGDSLAATSVKPLEPHRLSEEFEGLRQRATAHTASTGTLPTIFLANIGRVAEHTARATFARNFFEAGGIKALSNDGFGSADELAKAFNASGAQIAVICGSDAQYNELAASFARALKKQGAVSVYLAGKAGDQADAFAKAGIDDYVSIGANVLAICAAALDQLGVN